MRDSDETAAIPLAEERLCVSKRPVERQVRVRTVTEDVPETLHEELVADRVDVQHIAVERELTERPEIRFEDDVMIIPVIEERLVVEKKLFLVEEVHVRRLKGVERIEQPVVLRKQRVEIDRRQANGNPTEED